MVVEAAKVCKFTQAGRVERSAGALEVLRSSEREEDS